MTARLQGVLVMKKKLNVKNRKGEKWLLFAPGYWLSNCGRWYSEKSKKILKQYKNDSGYYRVCVYFPCGKKKDVFTHIAVVYLFGDKNGNRLPQTSLRAENLSIDHISRRKSNNSVFNLEIVQHAENVTRFYVKVGRARTVQSAEELDQELYG